MKRQLSTFKHRQLAYWFIAPQLFVTILFFLWPALKALQSALYAGDAFGVGQHFVGLDNFIDLFTDPLYLKAFGVTLFFSFCVTGSCLMLGLLGASLVYNAVRGQSWYQSILVWPYAVAPAVAAIIFRFLFNPAAGVFSGFLNQLGIDFNYTIIPWQAMLVVIISAVWQHTSYNFIFFLAALKSIPESLIDAAKLDGANGWERFWHIQLPMLSPMTFFLFTMNLLYAFFDTFGVIQVLTQGGPANATNTLIYKVYSEGFVGLDLGGSAAQSVILMTVVSLLILLQFKYVEQKVHYG